MDIGSCIRFGHQLFKFTGRYFFVMQMLGCEKYRQMAKGDLADRLAVAVDVNIPKECATEIYLTLTKDESSDVRQALAANDKMVGDGICRVLGRLSKDKDPDVLHAATQNDLFDDRCDGQRKMDYTIAPWYGFDVMRADVRCDSGCNYQRLIGELEAQGVDVVSVASWMKNQANSLRELGFDFIPHKISWQLQATFYGTFDKYLDSIKKGNYISHRMRRLAKEEISFVMRPVTKGEDYYEQWHSLYTETMTAKKRGRLVVKEETTPMEHTGLYAVKDGKVLGGILFKLKPSPNSSQPGLISGSYGTFIRNPPGLYDVAMAKMVEYAIQQKSNVNLGIDTNFYGFHLSTGLYSFKTSLGYKPYPSRLTSTSYVNQYFKVLNEEKFDDPYMYLGFPSYVDVSAHLPPNTALQNNIFIKSKDKLPLEPFNAPDGVIVHHNGKSHRYQVVEETDYFQGGDAGA